MSAAPTATVIVRSMGRPCLADAIASVVGQRHPSIELLVVDASGGTHPPLPPTSCLQSAKLVFTGERLNRPAAANVGLEHATGEWIGFLDDDDYLEPTHLQRLIARASEPDRPTLVYGQLWTLDHLHRVVHDRHHGFNPLILYYYCRTPGMSWILHRTLRDAGHRLDETLDTSEDWEFLLRMLTHARVATVRERTHFYFMEAGTSGTGSGSNRNDGESQQRCRDSVRTRYADERARAWTTYFEHLQTATALHAEGQMDAAAAIYATALRAHPDEPNALFLLGKLFEDQDRPHAARLLLRDAIYLNGDAAQYHLALARVCERLDAHEEARDAYASAARFDPRLRATADEGLARIARCLPSTSAGPAASGVDIGRNVRCPCGSGLRFKACHGALHASVASTPPHTGDVHELMTSAVAAAQAGDFRNARQLYGQVLACDAAKVDALHALALLELDMGDIHGASDRIELALTRAPNDLQIIEDRQRIRLAVHERAEATRVNDKLAQLPYLVPGTASLAPLHRAVDIHVVAAFRDVNGSREFAALALARMLAEDAPVTVWSTHGGLAPKFAARGVREIDVGQRSFPQSGTVIFVNVDPLPAVWLNACTASRVVAVHDTNQPAALLDLVLTMHRSTSCPIQLVTPSETFRRRCGVPAASCPLPVDLERFHPGHRGARRRRPFTIGRVSANDHRLFHPQDPALIRQLLDSGFAVRILGGTVLMRNFPPSKPLPGLELLAADAMSAPEFLRDIDCVFYRTSSLHAEAGGDSIAQALATGIPVVCARDVGYSELISHGLDGFVFDRDDDDEALRYLRLLQADVGLRERVGRAARAKGEAIFGPSLTRRLRRIYAGADSGVDRLRGRAVCTPA